MSQDSISSQEFDGHTGLSQDFDVIDLESTEYDQFITFESVPVKTEVDSEKLESLKNTLSIIHNCLNFTNNLI
jgi:hypothetical protein